MSDMGIPPVVHRALVKVRTVDERARREGKAERPHANA